MNVARMLTVVRVRDCSHFADEENEVGIQKHSLGGGVRQGTLNSNATGWLWRMGGGWQIGP